MPKHQQSFIKECKEIKPIAVLNSLFEFTAFSEICFGYELSYIGISEFFFIAYYLTGFYESFRFCNLIDFWLFYCFLCFLFVINTCKFCLMTAETWIFKLHNKSFIHFSSRSMHICIHIYIHKYILYTYTYIYYR